MNDSQCHACGGNEAELICGRCGIAQYCNQDCQRDHWKRGHKRECHAKGTPKTDAASAGAAAASPAAIKKKKRGKTKRSLPSVPSGAPVPALAASSAAPGGSEEGAWVGPSADKAVRDGWSQSKELESAAAADTAQDTAQPPPAKGPKRRSALSPSKVRKPRPAAQALPEEEPAADQLESIPLAVVEARSLPGQQRRRQQQQHQVEAPPAPQSARASGGMKLKTSFNRGQPSRGSSLVDTDGQANGNEPQPSLDSPTPARAHSAAGSATATAATNQSPLPGGPSAFAGAGPTRLSPARKIVIRSTDSVRAIDDSSSEEESAEHEGRRDTRPSVESVGPPAPRFGAFSHASGDEAQRVERPDDRYEGGRYEREREPPRRGDHGHDRDHDHDHDHDREGRRDHDRRRDYDRRDNRDVDRRDDRDRRDASSLDESGGGWRNDRDYSDRDYSDARDRHHDEHNRRDERGGYEDRGGDGRRGSPGRSVASQRTHTAVGSPTRSGVRSEAADGLGSPGRRHDRGGRAPPPRHDESSGNYRSHSPESQGVPHSPEPMDDVDEASSQQNDGPAYAALAPEPDPEEPAPPQRSRSQADMFERPRSAHPEETVNVDEETTAEFQTRMRGLCPNEHYLSTVPSATELPGWVSQPLSQNTLAMCQVVRKKRTEGSKKFPAYRIMLQGVYDPGTDTFTGPETPSGTEGVSSHGEKHLMWAKRRRKGKSVSYLISAGFQDLGTETPRYMAKLKANFKCDDFILYDDGHIKAPETGPSGTARRRVPTSRLSFKSRSPPPPPPSTAQVQGFEGVDPGHRVRRQIAQIQYTSHKISYTGPRQMLVTIPNPRAVEGVDDPQYFVNKLPEYDKQSKQHSLKFYGRATEASVKNFCLIRDGPRFQKTRPTLLFGKRDDDTFSLDFRWPMTPLQAIGIALSSFESSLRENIHL